MSSRSRRVSMADGLWKPKRQNMVQKLFWSSRWQTCCGKAEIWGSSACSPAFFFLSVCWEWIYWVFLYHHHPFAAICNIHDNYVRISANFPHLTISSLPLAIPAWLHVLCSDTTHLVIAGHHESSSFPSTNALITVVTSHTLAPPSPTTVVKFIPNSSTPMNHTNFSPRVSDIITFVFLKMIMVRKIYEYAVYRVLPY